MTIPNELMTDIATKGEQALDAFAELWKNRHSPLDQEIRRIISTQTQQTQALNTLVASQTQLAKQLTTEVQITHPERAFLEYAQSPQARLWLNQEANQQILRSLDHSRLTTADFNAIFSNDGLFTTLNHRKAKVLSPSQVLNILSNPGLRQLFAISPQLLDQSALLERINLNAFLQFCAQAEVVQLFAKPDFIKLFNNQDFIKLFNNQDFIKLFNSQDFIKALNQSALVEHFADKAFTKAYNPSQQLAVFSHSAIKALLNKAEVFKLLDQTTFVKLFNNQDFIKLFNNQDFITQLSNAETLSKITNASRTNPDQFALWPTFASTAAPVLGYFDTQFLSRAEHQRAAISAQYALALDTSNNSQIESAVQQGQINTLIHPLGADNILTGKPLYRDFVALGGRLIVNLYGKTPEQFLNHSFGWALDYTSFHYSNERLNAHGLTTPSPRVEDRTYCVAQSSLPAGAKAFLTLADKPNEVAGFYMRYGLGEVIGIGYNWRSGSDDAWDALLHGLIAGTALTYQRRYG